MLHFGFQKLEIYELSKALVKDIYKLSSSFPSDEKYILYSKQIKQQFQLPLMLQKEQAGMVTRRKYFEKGKKLSVKMSNYIAAVKKSNI